MDNKLIKKDEGLLSLVTENNLDELLEPLTKDIHLFDTFISGSLRVDDGILNNIKVGDTLILRREKNKFDDNSIVIYTSNKDKLGYIPETDVLVFARLMDAGKRLIAKVKNIDINKFKKIEIGIYLIDF